MAQDLLHSTRKRTRQMNTTTITTNNQDSIISDMLHRQQSLLQNNLLVDDDTDYGNDNNVDDDDDDDDVIFIKEQPVNYQYKKQRTISLPQLPHVKLLYNETINMIPRTQNDDELLHLTGSSTMTLDGNKTVNLNVINDEDTHSTITKHHYANPLIAPFKRHKNIDTTGNALTVVDFFKTDKDGHYVYQKDDIFGSNGRFHALDLLGQGTFGKVLKCYDDMQDKFVAVKIIRSVDRYREAAKTELRILNCILTNDPMGNFQCLLLSDYFDYKNHICLVTNLYGKSIYDFMCANGIARFPGSHIQAIARQLIRSVCFLHDLGIIHTDLKPENILLVDENYIDFNLPEDIVNTLSTRRRNASDGGKRKILKNPEIKIIDFGSAIFHDEYHPPIVSTRHYRAPEIVLGLSWSFPCDIWSIACVLVELTTGESLYPIHENFEHLAMMQRINGEPIPPKIIETMLYKVKHKLGNLPSDLNTTVVKHFNKKNLQLIWPERNRRNEIITNEKSIRRVIESSERLDLLISKILKIDYNNPKFQINWNLSIDKNWALLSNSMMDNGIDKETFNFWYWFVDLLRKMFEFDPTKRITAKEALEHEWFDCGILDEGISNYGNS
ncbi:hypothetical protein KAFR_0F02730 [Kazachstania africana CBS 2517]|uniref:Protein kinase domain-containing protein n=1 Tax=Kazachstania africana (strain ATCC 22294 / BCRC 22015 / CBS 2517 / CECT 1963 / NBRC 1671 / NRRL Y-8276) TaxID=1071382 RepID=H2AWX0_KAZAF|nr:hypothetical protein KAFR_0F02730 [Kazachstania africana CBS 2517]CCF58870.1 hypothetical protein KAFR_0F02730 [Kazachstania africana CBS 2517]